MGILLTKSHEKEIVISVSDADHEKISVINQNQASFRIEVSD
jgi:hypothetical protein